MTKKSLLVIFAALAIGTAAMTVTLTSPRPPLIIRDALKNFKNAGSFSVSATMDTVFRAKLPSDDASQATAETALPLHVVGTGAFNVAGSRTTGTVHFSVADEQSGASIFGAELRSAPTGTSYIKFDATPNAATTGPDLGTLAGRWFAVDKDAAAIFQPDGSGTTTAESQWPFLWSEIIDGNVLVFREQTASEIIGGANVWHFILDAKPHAFDRALVDLYGTLRIGATTPESDDRVLQAMSKHTVGAEVWIDKKTKQIKRFGIGVVPPPSETIQLPLTVVLDFSDYGKPVTVDVPQDVEPLSGALKKLFLPAAPAK